MLPRVARGEAGRAARILVPRRAQRRHRDRLRRNAAAPACRAPGVVGALGGVLRQRRSASARRGRAPRTSWRRRRRARSIVKDFRESYLPVPSAPRSRTSSSSSRRRRAPTWSSRHHRARRHQDHRMIAELTWNTFRDHSILEYEIPKYEGDLGHPQPVRPARQGGGRAQGRAPAASTSARRRALVVSRGDVRWAHERSRRRVQRARRLAPRRFTHES